MLLDGLERTVEGKGRPPVLFLDDLQWAEAATPARGGPGSQSSTSKRGARSSVTLLREVATDQQNSRPQTRHLVAATAKVAHHGHTADVLLEQMSMNFHN